MTVFIWLLPNPDPEYPKGQLTPAAVTNMLSWAAISVGIGGGGETSSVVFFWGRTVVTSSSSKHVRMADRVSTHIYTLQFSGDCIHTFSNPGKHVHLQPWSPLPVLSGGSGHVKHCMLSMAVPSMENCPGVHGSSRAHFLHLLVLSPSFL